MLLRRHAPHSGQVPGPRHDGAVVVACTALGDQEHAGASLMGLCRGPEPGQAGADDEYVGLVHMCHGVYGAREALNGAPGDARVEDDALQAQILGALPGEQGLDPEPRV